MSKSVASKYFYHNESRKTGGKRGAEDEGKEDEEVNLEILPAESSPISTTAPTAPPSWITKLRKHELRAELNDRSVKYEKNDNKSVLVELLRLRLRCEVLLSGNNFLNTDDFHRLLVPFLPNDALMAIRLASKPWSRVVDAFIDEGVESGKFIVHEGEEIDCMVAKAQRERSKLATRAIFLLNITEVGDFACAYTINLVVVEIPEGVERISEYTFTSCRSLTTVSFPTTLTAIGQAAFYTCLTLENVDLLHTNLQELGQWAFENCTELKSMTIPDSLQTLGYHVFLHCSKLVPSSIDVSDDNENDVTSDVVVHLRSKQAPRVKQEKNDARARRLQQRQARQENVLNKIE